MPVWPCVFLAERLWVPPGPADGWRDVGSVLHHGFAMVRSSHGAVHLSRQQPKAGVRELSPRRTTSLPGHQRTEVDWLGHLPAHGLLCIHDWGPAGWLDTLCNAAPRWLEDLVSALICDDTNNSRTMLSFLPVYSYASAVWCFPLHGSLLIKRHPGNMHVNTNMTQEYYRKKWFTGVYILCKISQAV